MNVKNLRPLLVASLLLAVIGAGLYLAPKWQGKARLEMQQKIDSLVAQIEDDLVTNHVRHAQAYLRILEIQKERTLRSLLMRVTFDSLPSYDSEKSLGPAKTMLTNAVVANNQPLAREAVKEIRKALITYGVRLEQLARANSPSGKTGRLTPQECTQKDEDTLDEMRSNFAASLRAFRLNSSTETAEQAFVDGWLALGVLGIIGPDFIGKYGENGRVEIRITEVELGVLQTELAELSLRLKGEEYARVEKQRAYIFRKTEEFDNLLGKFNIASKK